ncbi:hypothetical protein [Streptomyces sp. NPDC047928]|uniref:hypothetical protein n=1 Tax=unclassified Streptomyces TaxID=2593676 RepID=UPI003713C00F
MNPHGHHVVGVDAGTTDLAGADRLLHTLAAGLALPGGTFGCTHPYREGRPHLALSLAVPTRRAAIAVWEELARHPYGVVLGARRHGPADLVAGAAHAAAEHTARTAGRAVLFPGVDALTGTLTVGALLAASAVELVAVLGAPGAPDPRQPVATRDHVRPEWRDGRLVLATMPAAGGVLVPFEVPDPTPCCADH